MPDYTVIKTEFRGADRLTPILKKLGITVEQTGDRASRAFRRASRQASVFRGVLKGVLAAGVVSRGMTYASMAVRGLAEEFLDFDKNITKAVTRLPGGLNRSSEAFRQLSKAARDEAAKTEFTAGQTAKAVEQLALAGFEVNQVMKALPGVLQLATNADIEVEQATLMATKSLGAFGMRTKDAAQLQANLTRVNNVFSRAVSSAALNIEDMFETLKYAGPPMHAAGQTIETFAAATELMADRAIDASIAGTALRMAFVRLAKPPKEAKVALKKLGIEVATRDGNFRDFADILEDVGKKTAKMGNQQRLAVISSIFGVRAQGAMNALLMAGSDELRKYRGRLEKSSGAAEKMADAIRDSLTVRLEILRSTLIELGIKFVTAFTGKAGKGLDRLTEKIRKFDVKPIVDQTKALIKIFKDLWFAIKPIYDNLPTFVGFWLSYRAALKTIIAYKAGKFFYQLARGLKAAAVAQWLLNIATMAWPIGMIVIAVFGLLATLTLLITKYDEVMQNTEMMITNAVIGFRFVELKIMEGIETAVNFVADKINWLIKQINRIPGIDIPLITPRDYTSDLKAELKTLIKERDKLKRDFEAPVGRGLAGMRGYHAPQTAAAKEQAAKDAVARQQKLATAMQLGLAGGGMAGMIPGFGPRVTAPLGRGGEPQIGFAQPSGGEFKFIFENMPPGLKLAERKTTGPAKIDVEGLGQQ